MASYRESRDIRVAPLQGGRRRLLYEQFDVAARQPGGLSVADVYGDGMGGAWAEGVGCDEVGYRSWAGLVWLRIGRISPSCIIIQVRYHNVPSEVKSIIRLSQGKKRSGDSMILSKLALFLQIFIRDSVSDKIGHLYNNVMIIMMVRVF